MFKKNRAYISILLIFSFSLLVLPKSFLHDCAHQHAAVHKTGKDQHSLSFEKGIEKCAVCDLQAPQLFTPGSEAVCVFKRIDLPGYIFTYTQALKASSTVFYLRGPPQSV